MIHRSPSHHQHTPSCTTKPGHLIAPLLRDCSRVQLHRPLAQEELGERGRRQSESGKKESSNERGGVSVSRGQAGSEDQAERRGEESRKGSHPKRLETDLLLFIFIPALEITHESLKSTKTTFKQSAKETRLLISGRWTEARLWLRAGVP